MTIGSGGSSGVFAASLSIGGMLCTAFGTAANALFPGATAPRGAYGLVGMLHRIDVVRAYSRAMLDRLETQPHRTVPRSELRGTRVVQVSVDPGGRLVGKTLADLHLPGDMLVIGIDRPSETNSPRGDSELRPGDRLEILVRNDAIGELHEHPAAGTLTP